MPRTIDLTVGSIPAAVSRVDPATGSVQPSGMGTGWTLVDSEEFGGAIEVLDAADGLIRLRSDGPTWRTWYPNWAMFSALPGTNHNNDNYECYYATSKVALSGGNLVLTCDQQTTVAGLDYTAGMITTQPTERTYLYGAFEIYARITGGGTGAWPAFWSTSSAANTWNSEIDMWESFNNSYYVMNTYVDSSGTSGGGGSWSNSPNQTQDVGGWHTYACKWTATAVTFYRDGVQVYQTTANVPQEPHYLLLNSGARTAASPSFATAGLEVGYVRVWE